MTSLIKFDIEKKDKLIGILTKICDVFPINGCLISSLLYIITNEYHISTIIIDVIIWLSMLLSLFILTYTTLSTGNFKIKNIFKIDCLSTYLNLLLLIYVKQLSMDKKIFSIETLLYIIKVFGINIIFLILLGILLKLKGLIKTKSKTLYYAITHSGELILFIFSIIGILFVVIFVYYIYIFII